jgi:hypothetical protein
MKNGKSINALIGKAGKSISAAEMLLKNGYMGQTEDNAEP